ncbi:YigZ family protein [Lachnospiraceae bacterium DSM 108991]|uniref:YigZ family protein n=2 Tax=Lachnospiraceae TaxID=186803 RepID=A0A921LE47_9FIRM|nr:MULTISPECIES: YigZ family protein [Lachnospiraceae]MBE5062762.1 YigZ family protein [Claveliimonas monacensis]HJF94615.1 YigZ family protein [Lachnoclostridium phocaeense]
MVFRGGEGEITEKKSRFIATVRPVKSEEEAVEFIESVRKKYWDARHNCYAYVIGERQDIQRYSDDGEPGGTAGRPMLDVLLGENIHDTAVVVTRYFGGILLGTGGLVRAYQGAAKEGLSSSLIITRIQGIKLKITTDYTGLGKIQYILGERGIPVLDSAYTEKVELTALAPEKIRSALEEELTDGTNGRAVIEEAGTCFYGEIDGKIQVLE